MGYILFTESGAFDPAVYGLYAGSVIQIAAIGGGAGGFGTGCAAGQASSFGSILTAPGGVKPKNASNSGALLEGMWPGTQGPLYAVHDGGDYYGLGSQGGPGWVPGEAREYLQPAMSTIFDSMGDYRSGMYYWLGSALLKQRNPTTMPYGAGCAYYDDGNYTYQYNGAGGKGYGAGGAGIYDRIGGASGALRFASYILPNTDSITVTVGNGGIGGYLDNTRYFSGGGARGCVAVFW